MPELELLSDGSTVSNRYRVQGNIGGGAMAQVYKVEDTVTGILCALKVLCERDSDERGSATLFMDTAIREAGFLKALAHPCLPRYVDFFRQENRLYLVMEFIEGQNLKNFLQENEHYSLDVATIAGWGIQICDVLAYLHSQDPPIVFRDIKPSNLIRRPNNEICLVDFGIARYAHSHKTSDTIVLGSPGYAPPEQYGQGQTTPRSDIYAVGATMHHLLTGRDPSSAPFKWPGVRTLNPVVPIVLENLVARCLQMEAAKRPESAAAVAKSLREIKKMLEEAASDSRALSGSGDLQFAAVPPPSSLALISNQPTGSLEQESYPPAGSPEPSAPATAASSASVSASSTRRLDLVSYPDLPPPEVQSSSDAPSGEPQQPEMAVLPAPVQFARAEYSAPASERPFWQDAARLRDMRRGFALVSVIIGLGMPILGAFLETNLTGPTLTAYHSLLSTRLVLAALAVAAFLTAGIRSERPSRLDLLLCLGGTASLLCLTATTLLSILPTLFFFVAALELLTALPAALLLTK